MLMTTASYQADRLGSDDVPAQPTATCGVPTNTSAYNVPKLSLSKLTVNETGETASPIERQQKGIVTRDRDVGEIGASFDAELLTSAFSIPRFQTLDDIEDRCASMLGIKRDRLRIYSLTPLTADSALLSSHGTQRIAIEVEKSSFSLQAIEEILNENQQMRDQSETPIKEIEGLRRELIKLKRLLASSESLRHRGQQALQELKEEFETMHFDLTQPSTK